MDPLDTIRRQIEQGGYSLARRALVSFVRQHPGSIPAWTLLAGLVSDPVLQADCYRRILDLDPVHAEATSALQRLTETSPPAVVALRCPQCGGKLETHSTGKTEDKRATCWHCGSEVALPDAPRRVEHEPEQERQPTQTRPADRTVRETRNPEPRDPEVNKLARKAFAHWFAISHTDTDQPTTSPHDRNDRLLSPAEMITAAGGPLSPEERCKCPECGTTVSKRASRCEWCGTRFSDS
jgi:predicted RNA-binding Zn-ribbon protein involved in translation (DUF1610 family)